MSPAETARILAILAAAYPGFEVDEVKHRLWVELLGDLDYGLAVTAVKRHIATNRWPPTVADIREQVIAVALPDEPTAAEAWGEVMQAIRRHGYYREAEAMESLSPRARQVVQMLGWREINMCEEVDVLRGQFLRMYEQVQKRAREESLLPPELRRGAAAGVLETPVGERAKALAGTVGRPLE